MIIKCLYLKMLEDLSKYLSEFRIDPTYNRIKKEINSTLRKIPSCRQRYG